MDYIDIKNNGCYSGADVGFSRGGCGFSKNFRKHLLQEEYD